MGLRTMLGMKSKKKAPPIPDYVKVAREQADIQKELIDKQTAANRIDQVNPYGSLTYSTGPDGRSIQTTTLNPELQASLDSQMRLGAGRSQLAEGLLGQAQQNYSQPVDFGFATPYGFGGQVGNLQSNTTLGGLNFGGMQDVQGSDQNRSRAENAIYGSLTSRLDPRFQQQQKALDTSLANKGIYGRSGNYADQQMNLARQRNDAYNQAGMSAITGGGVEAQRNQGMDLALRGQQADERMNAANFGLTEQAQQFGQQQQAGAQNFNQQMEQSKYTNDLRTAQINEYLLKRGMPVQEMNALTQGQDVTAPAFQGYMGANVSQAPDLMKATEGVYTGKLGEANAAGAKAAGNKSAVAGIAGAALTFF